MARIDIPDGPGSEPARAWSLRPQMGAGVDAMVATAYQHSQLSAREREGARMRIAQLNDCPI
jgi:hypothetical protein